MKTVDIGGIEIYVEESEKYIQINDIQGEDLARVWEALTHRYPSYEVVLCFRNMPAPTDMLDSIEAVVLEDCIEMRVTPQGYKPHACQEITLLTKDDFAKLAAHHDKINPAPEFYWTSQRILDKWDIWRIFVVKTGGETVGYAMLMLKLRDETIGEIFGAWAEDPAHRKALFSAMAGCAFDSGKATVVRMIERSDTCEYDAALAVGFCEVGYYVGYQVYT